jgi:hypothetical protein
MANKNTSASLPKQVVEINKYPKDSTALVWKVYLWLLLAIILLTLLSSLRWTLVDYISVGSTLVGLVGSYGYVYRKNILSRYFWIIFTILTIIYNFVYILKLDAKFGGSPTPYLAGYLIGILMPLPLYIALLLYGFKSEVFKSNSK